MNYNAQLVLKFTLNFINIFYYFKMIKKSFKYNKNKFKIIKLCLKLLIKKFIKNLIKYYNN